MPITIEEQLGSPIVSAGDNANVELRYLIAGTASDVDAMAELNTTAPATYNGIARREIQVEPHEETADTWLGVARYSVQESTPPPSTGESTFAFDTSGGSQHITQSRLQVNAYAPPSEAVADFKGAIGVADQKVEGTDIVIPVYSFSETHYIADAFVNNAFKANLMFVTGKMNNSAFKGLASGECLFLGASGAKRGIGDWEITYRFAGSPNVTGLVIGDITGINKLGWDYLWVRYEDVVDETAVSLVKRPVSAYVERVYEFGNFASLGIGV